MPRTRLGLFLQTLLLILAAATSLPAQEQSQSWYETDASILRSGGPGTTVQRRTPREAVRNFVQLAEAGEFAEAALYLNLADLPQADRAVDGKRLARQLALVIERQLWIDWAGLSARPDAMIETGTSQNALAGRARRDIGLKLIEVDGQAYEIRLARYKADGTDPVWMFTPQTVHPPSLRGVRPTPV